MQGRDYRDIVGGGLLLLVGALITWRSATSLDQGTIERMGPGLFPTAVGLLLVFFAILILVPALLRPGPGPDPVDWRSALATLAGVGVFALAVVPLGIIPAIVILVIVSSLAETTIRPVSIGVMAVVLPAIAFLIFHVALGLPVVMFRIPT